MLSHRGTKTIQTNRLLLRPFIADDAQQMYENWASDPEVTRFLTWQPHKSAEETRELLESWVKNYDNPAYYNWVMTLDGICIGNVSIVRMSDCSEVMEFGYCMGSRWWKMGLMSEAVSAVTDYLFTEVGANRLVIRHVVANPASGRVARKCGFTYEGTERSGWNLPGCRLPDGKYHNIAVNSLLRSEWERRKNPRKLTLETERLILRPITAADAEDAHRYAGDPDVTQYMMFGGSPDLRATQNFVLDCERMWALENQRDWEFGITLKETGELIGACDFCLEDGGVELGWVLAKAHWKKGYAAEAARVMIDHVFSHSDYNRIFARCDAANYGSWRVMEKIGMTREAVFRKVRPSGNDEYVYAILREEWEETAGKAHP